MVWRIFSAHEWRFASLKGTDEKLKTLGMGWTANLPHVRPS
jgi:hypothetical protein